MFAFLLHRTLSAALLSVVSIGAPAQSSSSGKVELRLAQREAAPTFMAMSTRTGIQWYVEQDSLVSPAQIEHISVRNRGHQTYLDLLLYPAADSQLRVRSRGQVGRHVALLVEDQLVEAWPIVGAFGGTLTHSINVNVETELLPAGSAQRIAARFAGSRRPPVLPRKGF